MERLEGRVAIVTGAARGLGAASAEALCRNGASVMLTDLRDETGEETASALRAKGYKAAFKKHDVTDAAQWTAVVAETVATFGGLDILVNNAGMTSAQTIEDADAEDFRRMLEVNLIAPFLGMKAVLPAMRKDGKGSIINIASNSTQMVLPVSSIYGASKAALANLSKSVAVHCARSGYGIRVNSVHPGPNATAMMMGENNEGANMEIPMVKALINAIPMKRIGVPSEVAGAVAFLASDDASYITASELFVDGGLTVVSFADPG